MGKKKPFIDKKNASTYHLLHRSQRDVGGGGGDNDATAAEPNEDRILWPTEPQNLVTTDRAVLFGSSSSRGSVTAAAAASTTTTTTDGNHHDINHNHHQTIGKDAMSAWRSQLQQVGLLDDTDYEKYLKPITGTGTFLDGFTGRPVALVKPTLYSSPTTSNGNDNNNNNGSTDLRHAEEALVEVHRQLDSIPLTASCMDDDIAAVLFGDYDEGDYEELNDDFIFHAAAVPEAPPSSPLEDAPEAFDFDKHIQQLIAKAKLERSLQDVTISSHNHGQQDQVYFANLRPLHELENEYDDDDYHGGGGGTTVATEAGVVAKLNPAEERALCEKFEATLAEYDEDEDEGDYGSDDDDNNNNNNNGLELLLPLEGNAVVEAALDDYLREKEDEIFMQGRTAARYADGTFHKEKGGSGFSILVGTQMVPAKTLDGATDHPEQEVAVPLSELFQHAQEILAVPKQKPPPEEVFFDGQSYFSERQRNPWDCESILSTYSNLDNNPTTIDGTTTSRRRRRSQKQVTPINKEEEEESVQLIRLSAKTGLPLGVFDKAKKHDGDDDNDDDECLEDTTTVVSVNRGVARNRTETLMEKKARKWQIKRERELARLQKKVTRQVFQEEFQKRAVDVSADDIAGKTVFRFS